MQNYFFPRLEILLRRTCDFIQKIYGVNPYERMTFVYHPSNRKTARQNLDFYKVFIGLSGKRRADRYLTIKRRDGKAFFFHPTYLTYNIDMRGALRVELLPFRQYVDSNFIQSARKLINENLEALMPVLMLTHMSYSGAEAFINLKDTFTEEEQEENGILLFSPHKYFPVSDGRGLSELVITFISLYPLLDSFVSIGEGESPKLPEMLERFKDWWLNDVQDNEDAEKDADISSENAEVPDMPELDSYSFVRAGIWWSVLARDNWTCCSCGRSSKEEGITLEVDHIIPRSKGGTDDLDNLQTLCKKCNVGKSNKDNTDLRRKINDSKRA